MNKVQRLRRRRRASLNSASERSLSERLLLDGACAGRVMTIKVQRRQSSRSESVDSDPSFRQGMSTRIHLCKVFNDLEELIGTVSELLGQTDELARFLNKRAPTWRSSSD